MKKHHSLILEPLRNVLHHKKVDENHNDMQKKPIKSALKHRDAPVSNGQPPPAAPAANQDTVVSYQMHRINH